MNRACANCEAERGTLNRADENTTHGICLKHFVASLLEAGQPWTAIREGIDIVNKGQGFVPETKK